MKGALSVSPGSIFARDFLVERPLAEGGMGAVYVVRQISTGRQRALKLMQPALVENDDLRRRFLLEAKVGASIASEHVVEVHLAGVDEATGAPYLVMELLDGVDLETRLESHGPLSAAETRELFRQLCHALGLAHQAGIVHRDLKPANIFLAKPKRASETTARPEFHVKVLDFGIAKMTNDSTVGGAATGMIGTPFWMAPEQSQHVPVTPAADVWALGLILYTCITGRLFWRSADAEASVQQIMREMLFDPIPRATVRAEQQHVTLPCVLEPILERSIVRSPTLRFRDAGAFLAALDDAFEGKPPPVQDLELAFEPRHSAPAISATAATLPGIPTSVSTPAARPAPSRAALLDDESRHPSWLVPVSLAILLALGVAGFSRFRPAAGPVVSCRLCTVENGTVANGAVPLRQIRHDIESMFSRLDSACLRDATESGRATLKWVIGADDPVRTATATGGKVGECLVRQVSSDYRGNIGLGQTEVTYIVEWNPAVAADW